MNTQLTGQITFADMGWIKEEKPAVKVVKNTGYKRMAEAFKAAAWIDDTISAVEYSKAVLLIEAVEVAVFDFQRLSGKTISGFYANRLKALKDIKDGNGNRALVLEL